MIDRRIVSREEYILLIKTRFYLDPHLFGTEEEARIRASTYALCDALCAEVTDRGLSLVDDLYVLCEFNRKRIVGTNYSNGYQHVMEEIAYKLLQSPQWCDFGIELCAGNGEEMICGGEIELITKDEIVIQVEHA